MYNESKIKETICKRSNFSPQYYFLLLLVSISKMAVRPPKQIWHKRLEFIEIVPNVECTQLQQKKNLHNIDCVYDNEHDRRNNVTSTWRRQRRIARCAATIECDNHKTLFQSVCELICLLVLFFFLICSKSKRLCNH